ncbi:MAG TPA: hypothetical protein VN688_14525 [Gemmataceae bacterium]|nr:hypothetical protein [Gemmataceae bacterium]
MSEHIQRDLGPHPAPVAVETPERTPGVAHERGEFNLRLVVYVGLGLIVTAITVHLLVWWLLRGYEMRHKAPLEGESSLALDDANRPLGERLLNVPPPHLEGIERESTLLILRGDKGEEQQFFVAENVRVRIKDKDKDEYRTARLFELREGQEVTITYHLPGGVAGGLGVVTSATTPPLKTDREAGPELPGTAQRLTATIIKVEPRSVAAAREWAEVQMDRYGWADRQKGVARIPVAVAMEEVLQSAKFRPSDKKKTSRLTPPTRSNSGRGREKGKP